jgi:hypothetical protein
LNECRGQLHRTSWKALEAGTDALKPPTYRKQAQFCTVTVWWGVLSPAECTSVHVKLETVSETIRTVIGRHLYSQAEVVHPAAMSFAPNPNNGRRAGATAGAAAGSTTRSTVQYGAAPRSRGLGGGAPTFASAHSTKGTVVAHPTSKQVVGDRGQALVSIAR